MKLIRQFVERCNKQTLRVFATFLIGFFLLFTLITAFFAVPMISGQFQTKHTTQIEQKKEIEAELLKRFVKREYEILQSFANNPAIVNGAMLVNAKSANLTDLMDNFSILGEKARLALQNIEGGVIYQTVPNFGQSYNTQSPWVVDIIDGNKPYDFRLIGQEGELFTFSLAVPVSYAGSIEGVMNAEITTKLLDIFNPGNVEKQVAFRLSQGDVVIETSTKNITTPNEHTVSLNELSIDFTYIDDAELLARQQQELRNNILAILLVGLVISFFMFVFLSYRTLTDEEREVIPSGLQAYRVPLLVGILGISATIAAYLMVSNLEEQSGKQAALLESRELSRLVNQHLQAQLQTLDALKAFYDSSTYVDRREFKSFVTPLLKNQPAIQALQWVPEVLSEERTEYEEAARTDGLTNFTFIDKDAAGKFIKAGEAPIYYPVYYVEPYEANKVVLGLAPTYTKDRRNTIHKARDTGEMQAAAPFKLAQETGDQAGLLIFSPIYRGAQNYDTIAARRESFIGLVLLVMRGGDMVQQALEASVQGTQLHIEDVTDPQKPQIIFDNTGHLSNIDNVVRYTNDIDFAGRKWRVKTGKETLGVDSPLPYMVLVAGLLLTALVSTGLFQLIRRRAVVEALVEKRTEELVLTQRAITQAVEGISRINPEGEYLELNDAYAGMAGYTPDELVGKPWSMTVHADDMPGLEQAYADMLRDGQVAAEARGIRKDGSEFYKRVTMISQYDDEGQFIGHHCFMQDITERKQAEEEREQLLEKLVESNAELKLLNDTVANSNDIFMVTKADILDKEHGGPEIVYVNDAFTRDTGYSKEEAIGNTPRMLQGKNTDRGELDKMRAAMNRGEAYNGELINYTKDGREYWVDVNISPIRDDDGKIIYFAAVERDVTARKEAEAIIKEKSDFLQLIFANSPTYLFVKDKGFNMVEANDRFLDLYPESERESVIGKYSAEGYSEEDAKEFLKYDQQAFDEGYSVVTETLSFPDGKTRTLYTQKVRFENTKGEEFILGIAFDVTDREKLIEKLTESNTELERFAYVASHDMQEPLRMVVNFSEVIDKKFADVLGEDGLDYLSMVISSGKRMQEMVNDLLEYSRVGSGEKQVRIVDANKEIEKVLDNLGAYIEETGAQVTFDELPTFNGNPVQFMRLLQNLIANGIKYQPKERTPEIHIGVKSMGEYWGFSVKDNGLGIDEHFVEQIFQPFRRLHTWDQIEGTGLGLAICNKIVQNHGGRIWVTSTPKKGSEFHFTIAKSVASEEDVAA